MADTRPYTGDDHGHGRLEEKLDTLNDYIRNHLTSKMDGLTSNMDGLTSNMDGLTSNMNKRFDEVNDGLARVSNMLQDHVHRHPGE